MKLTMKLEIFKISRIITSQFLPREIWDGIEFLHQYNHELIIEF
jgi:hypothetical protein